MQLRCPHCGQLCETEQELVIGQYVVCPFCHEKFSYGIEEGLNHVGVNSPRVMHRQQCPSLFEKNRREERPVLIKLVSLFYALGTAFALWSLVRAILLLHSPLGAMLVDLVIAILWGGITILVWQGRIIGRWCVDCVSVLLVLLFIGLLTTESLIIGLFGGSVIALYWLCSVLCHLSGSTKWFKRPQIPLKQQWRKMSLVQRWTPVGVIGVILLIMVFFSGSMGGRGWSVTLCENDVGERLQEIVVIKQCTKDTFSFDYGYMVVVNEAEHEAEILLPDLNQDEKEQVKFVRYVDTYKYELYRDERWEDFVKKIHDFTKYQTAKEVIEYVSKFR